MKLTDIAVKNLVRRKAKAAFIMAGLVTGVATIVAVIGFVKTMTAEINHKMERFGANILILPRTEDLSLTYGGISLGGVSFEIEQIQHADIAKIATIKNAGNIAALGPVVLGAVKAGEKQVLLAGVDFSSTPILKPWWQISGEKPGIDGVLAGSDTARVMGLKIGEPIRVNGKQLVIAGILKPTGSQDDHLLFAHLPVAQSILNKTGRISMVEVAALCSACPIEEMVRQISNALPDARVMAIQKVVKGRMDTLSRFKNFSFGMSIVVILVGSLVVLVTMMSSVRERTEEIGIFRAIGFRKKHVMAIIFSEAAMISGPAGLIGYLLGTLAIAVVFRFFTTINISAIHLDPLLLLMAVVISTFVGMAASVYPAIMAARLDPNTALRSL